jgi:DNA-binding XRE family transcriptional regulator
MIFPKGPPTATMWPGNILLGYLKRFREVELDITQEAAARLLGISKNTWIRWEQSDKYDKNMLSMLDMLVKKHPPSPCSEMRYPPKWDWKVFDGHVRVCEECQRMIEYLAAVVKSTTGRKTGRKSSARKPSK